MEGNNTILALNSSIDKSKLCISGKYSEEEQRCLYTDELSSLKNGFPLECSYYGDPICVSKLNSSIISECTCRYPNTEGKRYCAPLELEQLEYFTKEKSFAKRSFKLCSYASIAYNT